jgi:hypothetical protein
VPLINARVSSSKFSASGVTDPPPGRSTSSSSSPKPLARAMTLPVSS